MSENDLNGLQNIDLHIEMSEREKAEQTGRCRMHSGGRSRND
jgi:hypothetical protein